MACTDPYIPILLDVPEGTTDPYILPHNIVHNTKKRNICVHTSPTTYMYILPIAVTICILTQCKTYLWMIVDAACQKVGWFHSQTQPPLADDFL